MWDLLELGIKPISSELAGGFFLVVCISRRHLLLGRRAMTNLDSIVKSKGITADKVLIVKAMVFPVVMYGWMWELDKEGWAPKIDTFKLWCWRRLLRVPWTARRLKQSILKEINPQYSLEGLMLEAAILWPPDGKSWLIQKNPHAGKDWRQKNKVAEDEMVGWCHQLNGHELEQTLRDGEGEESLACYSSWGHKESDTT